MSLIGISGIETEIVYALDLDTIKEHDDQYHEEMKRYSEEEQETIEWSIEDEAYLFQFRQLIDDIPLSNVIWTDVPREAGESTQTKITVIYTDTGIIRLDISGFYELLENGDLKKLIAKNEAL